MKRIIKIKESIIRKPPENYKDDDLHHFKSDLDSHIDEIHYLEHSNIKIVQRYIYKYNIIYGNYVHTHGVPFSSKIKSVFKPFLNFKKSEPINKGIWTIDTWSRGYFHWFTEFLPRCITAKEFWNDYPILIPSYFLEYSYIKESLDLFPFRIQTYSIYDSYKVNNLIITSRLKSAMIDPNQIKEVRSFLRETKGLLSKPKRRVYISRSKSERRKILNENELLQFIKPYGFECFYLEELSFLEQKKIMSESEMIISNHGAGLTNMMFMPDNSRIIELKANVTTINNCFFNLARALDHDYYYTLNTADSNDVQKANIIVDIKALKKIFKTF